MLHSASARRRRNVDVMSTPVGVDKEYRLTDERGRFFHNTWWGPTQPAMEKASEAVEQAVKGVAATAAKIASTLQPGAEVAGPVRHACRTPSHPTIHTRHRCTWCPPRPPPTPQRNSPTQSHFPLGCNPLTSDDVTKPFNVWPRAARPASAAAHPPCHCCQRGWLPHPVQHVGPALNPCTAAQRAPDLETACQLHPRTHTTP